MKRLFITFIASSLLSLSSHADDGTFSYKPTFHGTIRGQYEYSTPTGDSRFMVRNARASVSGSALPKVGYFLQVDFCDRGKILILDAYASVTPVKGLKLMAGQMRVPFDPDAARAPHAYFFANRSFPSKTFGNLRAVGAKASYSFQKFPLYLEAGAFDDTDKSDHTKWNEGLTYGAKAVWGKQQGWKPAVFFMSRVPQGAANAVRINSSGINVAWTDASWHLEGEYIYRHYTNCNFDASHAFYVFGNYGFPVKWPLANRFSVQARYDMMTSTSNGIRNDEGMVVETDPHKHRITVGATASYQRGIFHADYRLNFEQYFYKETANPSPSDNSKLVAGVTVYF